MTERYNDEHDAYYDDKKNEWLDGICGSDDCDYCKSRPEKPSQSTGSNSGRREMRKDESKEVTILMLHSKLIDLKREIRTIENAMDYLEEIVETKEGDMYCAVEGCRIVDESHTAYCSKHGRSYHKIKGDRK